MRRTVLQIIYSHPPGSPVQVIACFCARQPDHGSLFFPTQWPKYKIPCYEKVFQDKLITHVAHCVDYNGLVTVQRIELMYQVRLDQMHKKWSNEQLQSISN